MSSGFNYTIPREELSKAVLGTDNISPLTGLQENKPTKAVVIPDTVVEKLGPVDQSSMIGKTYTMAEPAPKSFYRILGDNYHPEFDPVYTAKLLADNQTRAGKFVAAMNRAIVGEVIGGTMQGVGYLLDIPMMVDLAEGTEQEFGNWFSKLGESLKQGVEDFSPIYTDPYGKKFNPWSFEWWMKNIPSVASTVSLVLPSMAGMSALKYIGEATKLLKAAGKADGFSNLLFTSLGQAIMSRHMESLMEATGDFENNKKEAISLLYNKYKDQIESEIKSLPLVTPVDPETGPKPGQYTEEDREADINRIKAKWDNIITNEANRFAAQGAANTYSKNWVLLLQDLPQYMMLNKIKFRPSAKPILRDATEKSAMVAKQLGYNMPAFYANKYSRNILNALGEGGEEAYQFIVNKQSAEMVKKIDNPNHKYSLLDALGDAYDDGEFWTNAWFGAIGAGVMQASMAGINHKALYNANKTRLKEITSYSEAINKLHSDILSAQAEGNDSALETAYENFVATVGLRSIDLNTKKHLFNLVDALAEDDTDVLTNYEVAKETRDFFRDRKDISNNIKSSIDRLEKYYNNAKTELANKGLPSSHKLFNTLARSIAHSNYMLDYLNKRYEAKKDELINFEIPGFNKKTSEQEELSEYGKDFFRISHLINIIKNKLKLTTDKLSKENLSESERKQTEKQRDRLQKALEIYNEELTNVKELAKKGLSKEQKAVDKKLIGNLDKKDGVISAEDVNKYISIQRDIADYESNIDYFKDNLEEAREAAKELVDSKKGNVKEIKPTEKERDKSKPPEDEDDTIKVGDKVNYVDPSDNKLKTGLVEHIEYATKDSSGKAITPSGESANNLYTIKNSETGEVRHVYGDIVTPIDKKAYIDESKGLAEEDIEDIVSSNITEEEINESEVDEISKKSPIISLLSYTQYEVVNNRKVVKVRNENFNKFVSDPENVDLLKTALVSYKLDLLNPYFTKQGIKALKKAGLPEDLINRLNEGIKNKSVSKEIIKELISHRRFIEIVPISISIKAGKTKFSKGLYLHTNDYINKHGESEAIKKYSYEFRRTLVSLLLENDSVWSSGLTVHRGKPNTIDKSLPAEKRQNNVAEVLGIDPSEVELYVLKSSTKFSVLKSKFGRGYDKPRLYRSSEDKQDFDMDFSSVGSVFVKTNKTINGVPYAIKLNKAKISKEHAFILFNAFSTLAKTELDKSGKFKPVEGRRDRNQIGEYSVRVNPGIKDKKNDSVWNLSAGELIDLLIVHGKERTDPDSDRYKYVKETKGLSEEHKEALKHKRLFLERGYDQNGNVNAIWLCYGYNSNLEVVPGDTRGTTKTIDFFRINLTEDIRITDLSKPTTAETAASDNYFDKVAHFINWASTYKTYAVHLKSNQLNLELNGNFLKGRRFRIGGKGLVINPSDLSGKRYTYRLTSEIIREPNESYAEFLIRNNFVTTDIQPTPEGRIFTTPFISLETGKSKEDNYGLKTGNVKTTVVRKRKAKSVDDKQDIQASDVTKKEEPTKKKRTTKEEKKTKEGGVEQIVKESEQGEEVQTEVHTKKDETTFDILNDDLELREAPKKLPKDYEKQDLEKELKWIRARLNIDPDKDIRIEDRLYNMVRGGRTGWAIYTNSMIILYRAAEKGTLYHEAFHRVVLGYFTEEERERFYRSARILYNMSKDKYSDYEVGNVLAEKFRDYVISREQEQLPSLIKRVFSNIYNFIKALLFKNTRIRHSDVERLFNQIYSGRFRFYDIHRENVNNDAEDFREISDTNFGSITTYKDVTDITKFLALQLFKVNKVTNLNKVKDLDFNKLITRLEDMKYRLLERENSKGVSEQERNIARKARIVITDILGNREEDGSYPKFEVFKRKLTRFLRTIGIIYREREMEQDDFYFSFEEDWEDADNVSISKIGSYGGVDFAKSIKDNALASVKFFINTLHESDNYNESLGILGFADGNKVWGKLLNDIIIYDNIEDMIDKIREKGIEEDYYPYIELADKLSKSTDMFKTQFQTTFEMHKHNFVNASFQRRKNDPGVRIMFDSASFDNLARSAASKWSAFAAADSRIVSIKEEVRGNVVYHTRVANDKFFEELLSRYEDKVEDKYNKLKKRYKDNIPIEEVDKLLSEVAGVLNELNINVSKTVLKRYIYLRNRNKSFEENLDFVITEEFKNIISPDLVVDEEGNAKSFITNTVVRNIGKAYADVNSHEEADLVLGADGASYYRYAKLNLITDYIRKAKRSEDWAKERLNRVNNRSSLILNKLATDEEFRQSFGIATLSSFRNANMRGDTGREFLKLNTIEDYVLKASSIFAGYLPLPTLANRQTYYLIEGFKPIGVWKSREEGGGIDNVIKSSSEDGTVIFTDEVVDVFYNYYLDEKDRVEKAKSFRAEYERRRKELTKALKDPESDKESIQKQLNELKGTLIREYHYSGGKFDTSTGNAYNFIHFQGFENIKTPEEARAKIQEVLNELLKREIEFLNKEQVISRHFSKDGKTLNLYNNFLDDTIVTLHDDTEGPQNFAVLSTIAQIMVNSQIGVIESEKVFLGDQALFKRNSFKENNVDTFDAVYKRWFGPTSTGTRVRVNFKDMPTTYNTSVLLTQKIKHRDYDDLVAKHEELYYEMLYNRLSPEERKDEGQLKKIRKTAKEYANGRLSKYTNIDPTDGISYISPEMHKQIQIRLGLFTEDVEKAFNILNSEKELSAEEIIEAGNIVFNPIKTMYIGHHDFNGIDMLIYDKTAMFPLFRQLVKNTHLEGLLDRMELRGQYKDKGLKPVHVFKYDTAVKVGGTAAIPLFKNGDDRTELNDLSDAIVIEQNFDYIKHQQVIEPHDGNSQLFGTAGFKIGMVDIDKDAVYGDEGTGEELLIKLNKTRATLSEIGVHKLNARFGIINGRINKASLINLLKEDAEAAGKPEDFISCLRVDKDTGEQFMEIDSFPDKKWLYARIKTIVDENTIDLVTPGNQLVQMSDFGMAKHSFKSDLRVTRSKVGSTKVYEMECRISARLFQKLIPAEKREDKEFMNKFLEQGVFVLGYRVPTQGQNSMFKLKVVDFLPSNTGDIIMLPLEFTGITGSDFDIDKLFVASYNYEKVLDESGEMVGVKKVEFSTQDDELDKRYNLKKVELLNIYRNRLPILELSSRFLKELTKTITQGSSEYDLSLSQEEILELERIKLKIKNLTEALKTTKSEVYRSKLEMHLKELQYRAEEILYRKEDGAKLDFYKRLLGGIDKRHVEDAVEYLISNKILPTKEEFAELPIEDQNTEAANQNRLLDLLFVVLTDIKHFVNTTTPLGAMTDYLEKKSVFYDELYKDKEFSKPTALHTTIPSFQASMKNKFSSSETGIASFALSNNHLALTQAADITMNSYLKFGWNKNKTLPINRVIGHDDAYISWWLSALIDIHVDGVNKPVAPGLNINESTRHIVNFLIRIGLGDVVFDLINQPVVREYAYNSTKVLPTGKNRYRVITPLTSNDAFIETLSTYQKMAVDSGFFKEEELSYAVFKDKQIPLWELLNKEQLVEDAKVFTSGGKLTKEWYTRQLSLLFHLIDIDQEAKIFKAFVLACRIDTKKYGSNPTEIVHFLTNIANLINSGKFNNIEKVLTYKGSYTYKEGDTFLPTLIKNNMIKVFQILKDSSIYASSGYLEILDSIIDSTASGSFNRMSILNTAMDGLTTYFIGKFFADKKVGFGMDYRSLIKLFENSPSNPLFNTLMKLSSGQHPLSSVVKENAFLNSIVVDFSNKLLYDRNGDPIHYVYIKALFKDLRDTTEKDELINGFKELIYSEHKELRDLAVQLYLYSFYTSGFKSTKFSYASWIPSILHKEIEFEGRTVQLDNYIKTLLVELNKPGAFVSFAQEAKREVFLNNWHEPGFVKHVQENDIEYEVITENDEPSAIKVIYSRSTKSMYLGVNENRQFLFTPFIIRADDGNLYQYVGYDKDTKDMYFVVVSKKGFSSRGVLAHEYGIKDPKGGYRSIWSFNNPHQTSTPTVEDSIKHLKSKMEKKELINFVEVKYEEQIVKEKPDFSLEDPEDPAGEMRLKEASEHMEKQEIINEKLRSVSATDDYSFSANDKVQLKENSKLAGSTKSITSIDSPMVISADGSAKTISEDVRELGVGAYSRYNSKPYYLHRNDSHIRSVLNRLAERNGITIPKTISNPTAELYSILAVLHSFINTSEHIIIENDNQMAVLFFKEGNRVINLEGSPNYTPKEPILKVLYSESIKAINKIESNGGSVKFKWVPSKSTEGNRLADSIAGGSTEYVNINVNENTFLNENWGVPIKVIENTTLTKEESDEAEETNKNCK